MGQLVTQKLQVRITHNLFPQTEDYTYTINAGRINDPYTIQHGTTYYGKTLPDCIAALHRDVQLQVARKVTPDNTFEHLLSPSRRSITPSNAYPNKSWELELVIPTILDHIDTSVDIDVLAHLQNQNTPTLKIYQDKIDGIVKDRERNN